MTSSTNRMTTADAKVELNVKERWSNTFYGSPPAMTVWAGPQGLPDSRREIMHLQFASKQQRTDVGCGILVLIEEHNAFADALEAPHGMTEAMIEAAAIEAHHASCANVPQHRPNYRRESYPWGSLHENAKAAWRAIATAVLDTAMQAARPIDQQDG